MRKMKINKKRKLKNYFKLGLLLIGIPFTLINCEKDIEIIDLTESNQQVFDPIKNLTLDEALNDIEFSQISISLNLTKKNLAHKNGQDDVIYIDTKNIIKIIKKDYITYTFLIINKKQENKNSFTNLIVEKSTNKTRGYLAHYLPTNEYLNKKAKGIKTPFQGTVSFSSFTEDIVGLLSILNRKISNTSKNNLQSKINDCSYQTVTIETSCASGKHWPGESCDFIGSSLAASSRFVEALVCDESGGGGSGIIYEYPPIFIDENENIGISGGGNGSSYIPPSGSTYPNLPAELTDSIDPITDFVFPDEIFIDTSFENSKANCAYKLLRDNIEFNKILDSLIPKGSQYNVTFKVGDIEGTATGSTDSNTDPNKTDITITIDDFHVENSSIISVALSILHESVHARLIEKVKSLGGLGNLAEFAYLDSEMEQLAAYYNKYDGEHNPAHHDFIWDNYVDKIANGVESFHKLFPEDYIKFHNYMIGTFGYNKDTFYKLAAKGSLQKTAFFKNLTTTEQTSIQIMDGALKSSAKKITDQINCK